MITVAFMGHSDIDVTDALRERVRSEIVALIESNKSIKFLLGSRSDFNDLCRDVLSELKVKYPHIRRVYVRAEYEYINDDYTNYLLERCDETYYPPQLHGLGKYVYVRRNQIMVEKCNVLIVYCDENYVPLGRTRSGTKMAVDFANRKHKRVINVFES